MTLTIGKEELVALQKGSFTVCAESVPRALLSKKKGDLVMLQCGADKVLAELRGRPSTDGVLKQVVYVPLSGWGLVNAL